MASLGNAIRSIGALDDLATLDSPIHRLDPRGKVVVTAAFVVTAVSFPKYELAELMPLFLLPATAIALGRIPVGVVARCLLLASPFAVMVGVFNPILDRTTITHFGPLAVTGGWVSFASIVMRFVLTAGAALLLLACTGYVGISVALGWFRMPRVLVTQFLLLYRFMFVLSDEAARMTRARELRSVEGGSASLRVWGSLTGHLLLRAHDRALRLHSAMLSRGFDGALRTARCFRWTWTDSLAVAGCCGFLAAVRFGNLAERLGRLTVEVMR